MLICGVGFGLYRFAGPAGLQNEKPIPTKVKPEILVQLREREKAVQARQQQAEDLFRASLGLSNAQIGQLAKIESESTSPRDRAEGVRALLTADQLEKYQQRYPEMRWAGRGGFGAGGGDGWRGGRRGGGDAGTSATRS